MTSQEITRWIRPFDLTKDRISRPNDKRLWEITQNLKVAEIQCENSWVILGHPDDEGVELNRGRKGAFAAPETFRKYFYSLTEFQQALFDVGDTDPLRSLDLKKRHSLAEQVSQIILQKNFLLAIGGGHDYAYPNIKAFLDRYPENSLVLNIDAHLDLRPQDPQPHSGTGFRRLFEVGYDYQLIEYGFHKCFASQEQLDFAKKNKVTLVSFEDRKSALPDLLEQIESAEHIFLSIDIDGFSSSIAPGASAAWPIGLSYEDVEPLLQKVYPSMRAMGIYELAPQLDVNDQTAKLAAQLAHKGIERHHGN